MKRVPLLFSLAIALFLSPASVKAIIIPISSTETIFNFDFTSLDPSPPYTNIQWSMIFDESDPVTVGTDVFSTKIYGGLNGTELIQTRNSTASFLENGTVYPEHTTAHPMFDPMLDGTFSYGLQMTSGTGNLVSLTACGVINGAVGPCMTHPIPEPATLLLLGGLALVRRRRQA